MLTPPDESFTHQVAFPHAIVGSSDPSWRERYWVSLQDTTSGETVLTFGIGQYPNQDVQEAFMCLSHQGLQHNLRLSRPLLPASDVMQVGPFSAEIVDAYRTLRFMLDDNDSGVTFELDWLGRFKPFLEERHFEVSGARVTHDLVRYVQVGRGQGVIRLDGREILVEPATWWGERDHSWGLRPLRRTSDQPPVRPDWSMLLFMPLQFEQFGLHLYLFEDAEGFPTHLSCGVMDDGSSPDDDQAIAVEHDVVWDPDSATPTLVRGTLEVRFRSGRRHRFELEALPGRAYLRGGGYGGIDGWTQGQWRDGQTAIHDVWDLSDSTRLGGWGAYSSDHLLRVRSGGETGYGIVEYMVLPTHQRYGFVRG